jgi:hypothetical protein
VWQLAVIFADRSVYMHSCSTDIGVEDENFVFAPPDKSAVGVKAVYSYL